MVSEEEYRRRQAVAAQVRDQIATLLEGAAAGVDIRKLCRENRLTRSNVHRALAGEAGASLTTLVHLAESLGFRLTLSLVPWADDDFFSSQAELPEEEAPGQGDAWH